MCPPHTAFVPKYGQKLTALGEFLGYWQLQEGAAAADKNAKLECLAPFFCWRFSQRVGFGEKGMRLFGSSRNDPKVPAQQFSLT